ncbi:hypothetical protein B0T14DRAFT_205317 [Immersiella caudata]|uniref:Uncharacterized protein n=1 Tax=Immersiella caudata TaxID=314043 RepID=A0AA39WPV7_9PEZI|nr:hypothetical protein B0T14DRAFT_205317 [Immersiella caudata]
MRRQCLQKYHKPLGVFWRPTLDVQSSASGFTPCVSHRIKPPAKTIIRGDPPQPPVVTSAAGHGGSGPHIFQSPHSAPHRPWNLLTVEILCRNKAVAESDRLPACRFGCNPRPSPPPSSCGMRTRLTGKSQAATEVLGPAASDSGGRGVRASGVGSRCTHSRAINGDQRHISACGLFRLLGIKREMVCLVALLRAHAAGVILAHGKHTRLCRAEYTPTLSPRHTMLYNIAITAQIIDNMWCNRPKFARLRHITFPASSSSLMQPHAQPHLANKRFGDHCRIASSHAVGWGAWAGTSERDFVGVSISSVLPLLGGCPHFPGGSASRLGGW